MPLFFAEQSDGTFGAHLSVLSSGLSLSLCHLFLLFVFISFLFFRGCVGMGAYH